MTPKQNALSTLEKRIRSRMDPKLLVVCPLSEDDVAEVMRKTLVVGRGEGEDAIFGKYLDVFNESVCQVFEVCKSLQVFRVYLKYFLEV